MNFRMAWSAFSLASVLFVAADVSGQPRGDWINLGSNGQAIMAIAPSPSSPRTIYVVTFPDRLYRTDDGGVSWSAATAGLPATGAGFIRFSPPLAVDPASPKTAYIGWWEYYPPSFAKFDRSFVFKTLDGGSSWLPAVFEAGDLVIDPSSPATLYLAGSAGVRRSDDRGASWHGPAGPGFATLALDPSNTSTIFAASSDSGVSKSVDRGSSWAAINTGFEQNEGRGVSATSIAIDPNDSRILYVAAGPRPTPTTRALYKSVDSGLTWSHLLGLPAGDVLQVRAAGTSPTAVYCLVQTPDGKQLNRSVDQGVGWTNITSNLPSPILVEVSPGEPATIYAGTASAGLFTRTFLARAGSFPPAPRTVPYRR